MGFRQGHLHDLKNNTIKLAHNSDFVTLQPSAVPGVKEIKIKVRTINQHKDWLWSDEQTTETKKHTIKGDESKTITVKEIKSWSEERTQDKIVQLISVDGKSVPAESVLGEELREFFEEPIVFWGIVGLVLAVVGYIIWTTVTKK